MLDLHSINFVWPRLLWLLCLLPVLALIYARMIRRPRAGQISLAHLQVGAAPAPRGLPPPAPPPAPGLPHEKN